MAEAADEAALAAEAATARPRDARWPLAWVAAQSGLEGPRSGAGEAAKDAGQMALVGEARLGGQAGEPGLRLGGQPLADEGQRDRQPLSPPEPPPSGASPGSPPGSPAPRRPHPARNLKRRCGATTWSSSAAPSAAPRAALLLRREQPELSVLVVERAAAFDSKVGEATTEMSAMFLTRRLALWKHLELHHLPKEGLRYWSQNERVTGHAVGSEYDDRSRAAAARPVLRTASPPPLQTGPLTL
jgi:hypothetical protein